MLAGQAYRPSYNVGPGFNLPVLRASEPRDDSAASDGDSRSPSAVVDTDTPSVSIGHDESMDEASQTFVKNCPKFPNAVLHVMKWGLVCLVPSEL